MHVDFGVLVWVFEYGEVKMTLKIVSENPIWPKFNVAANIE